MAAPISWRASSNAKAGEAQARLSQSSSSFGPYVWTADAFARRSQRVLDA
jgi:putative ABC transport system permease protein